MDAIDLKAFLENIPPGKEMYIEQFTWAHRNGQTYIAAPRLELYCQSEACNGTRFFEPEQVTISGDEPLLRFLAYKCKNCNASSKTYSLRGSYDKDAKKWAVEKFGEIPSFGPPTPSRALTLIRGERELYVLGRRCENQGMGIGAFVYYRRVIESQKGRILDELARVIKAISPQDPILADIQEAKKQNQFTTAVEAIKHALPQSLFINGYNPLTLLHSALSEGVHEHNDAECLELASSVRTILIEFAERLGETLKDEAELKAAVGRLAQKKSGPI
jgi:hypothetical protein